MTSCPDTSLVDSRPTGRGVLSKFRDPSADPADDRARLRFAAMMLVVGVLHFVMPGPFRKIVPRWFPWREQAVVWSGVAEITTGVLVAVPATRKAGGWLGLATVAAVYPANIQMAVDASRGQAQVPGPAWVAWARLPLQLPMLRDAWRLTR